MVTIAQIAKEAKVSKTTASFVLNGKGDAMKISKRCQKLVLETAQRLGYRGNYHARALTRGSSMTLGFLSNIFLDPARDQLSDAVIDTARDHGYETLQVRPGEDAGVLDRGIDYLRERRIDGLVVYKINAAAALPVLEKLPRPLPIVFVWFYECPPFPMITQEPTPGLEECARHLADLGHTDVCWLGIQRHGENQLPERFEAFTQAAGARDLTVHPYHVPVGSLGRRPVRINNFYQALIEGWDHIQTALKASTAVLCYNDELAVALNYALRERGVRIPQDLSIVGYDDVLSEYAVPALTTITHGFREMGQKAVETVISMATSPETTQAMQGQVLKVPSRLITRQSTTTRGS
jgi:DNA-binding LacI/PurR family transcriptional regulator